MCGKNGRGMVDEEMHLEWRVSGEEEDRDGRTV